MKLNFSQEQVSAFRLQRHYLFVKNKNNIVKICSNICGAQAQVLSAAYLSLFCRNQNVSKVTIDNALIKKRSLVRTSLMRQTLHVIPSNEYSLYINALKRSRTEAYAKLIARLGVTKKEIYKLNGYVYELLSDGPKDKNELVKIIRPTLNKNLKYWSYVVWSIFKPAIIEGLICYYPSNGNKSTFIRTDSWLPAQKEISEEDAKRFLLKEYLSAYGPATVKDFAYWAGMLMKEASETWDLLKDEIREIKVEDSNKYLLRKDFSDLRNSHFDKNIINLLPNFDVYLLAHTDKNHFIKTKHYKKVFRNAGWISSVILLNGAIIGTWSVKNNSKESTLSLDIFEKISAKTKKQIEEEAERVRSFLKVNYAK
jgi:uncharacterized protein YcaQ